MMKAFVLSSRGVLTLQFLFGFALVLNFILLFALMVFTLAMSSVVQYVTFSSARHLFLGAENKDAQRGAAKKKYNETLSSRGFKVFFNPDVIKIDDAANIGINDDFSATSANLFYGVWTTFQAKILMVKPILFGNEVTGDKDFTTSIGSYLGREPSQKECDDFDKKRLKKIKDKARNANVASIDITVREDEVFDNGC